FYEDLRDAEIQLELDLAENGAPLPIECDAPKVDTAVGNLLRNAIESTAEAARALGATPGPIRISTSLHDGSAWLEIADHGVGLSDDARTHLFEPFFTTKRNGTGLGLVTSQRFV